MLYTRRDIGKLALAAGAASGCGTTSESPAVGSAPSSMFGGVQIGIITYSFRALPGGAEEVLQYCVDCGLYAIELMSGPAESYAGVPPLPPVPRGPDGRRRELTPEEQEARQKAVEARRKWRLSAPMDKYKELRAMYEDAGVKTFAFKLPPAMDMPDEEYEYIWNVAETMGADHVTMELPHDDELLQRVAEYAAKRRLRIAFHTHGQGGASGFDKALAASDYTALNFDVGHYFAVNGESPVPLVEKYSGRIASLHLKDRQSKEDGGRNMPWGQGGTPLAEVLQLMKAKGYKFPASIEYEYETPEGSNVLAEIKKCREYCENALA